MNLIVLTGTDEKRNIQAASQLRSTGYRHLDPNMFFTHSTANVKRCAKTIAQSKHWCKQVAKGLLNQGLPVVISSNAFGQSDLQSFKAVYCQTEFLETDKLTQIELKQWIEQRLAMDKRWNQPHAIKPFFALSA